MGTEAECKVVLLPSGRQGRIPRGMNLLEGSRLLGVELESICGGRQTCGRCQIFVEEGCYSKMGIDSRRDHLTEISSREREFWKNRNSSGRRLACAAELLGDVVITVPEESQARKQIIAKGLKDRLIAVRPAVRQVYVTCAQARLDDTDGDWERLKRALADQWGLGGLEIDPVVLRRLQPALRDGNHSLTVTLWHKKRVIGLEPGYREGVFGLAVDIGSTTLAAYLCDLRTGRVLASESMMNPQVRFGEDLMSRISFVALNENGEALLHDAIIEAVNQLAAKAAATANVDPSEILDLVVVGNSVMHHLFLGLNPEALGTAPFALAVSGAVDLKARDLGLNAIGEGAQVYLPGCIAGQNGADNVAVLVAEAPHEMEQVVLVVDVGTNAEIVLGNRNRLLVTSSPTGPAFEGAQITHGQRAAPGAIERVRISPKSLEPRIRIIGMDQWVRGDEAPSVKAAGICGSGVIEAVAEMFLTGIIGSDGRFEERLVGQSERIRFNRRAGEYVLAWGHQTASGAPIVITQSDVRAIQLAKGALYAAIKLLQEKAKLGKVDRIVLTGGFGSLLSPKHAVVLGMVPDCELDRIQVIGNAAGDGARMLLVDRHQREAARRLIRRVEHISIAVEPAFQEEFVQAMAFPHALDAFPSVKRVRSESRGLERRGLVGIRRKKALGGRNE